MITQFGLYGDPSISPRVNLRNYILNLPISTLDSRISNAACHDLCDDKPPPRLIKSLLGLGLKFCPRPTFTTGPHQLSDTFKRFERDFYTKVQFAGEPDDPDWGDKQLFIRDEGWEPSIACDSEIIVRTQAFRKHLNLLFRRHKTSSNLNQIQQNLLTSLRNHPDYIVLNSDKNLGPVVMNRETYVKRCLVDHLMTPTYVQLQSGLQPGQAHHFVAETRSMIQRFLQDHRFFIRKFDMKYLERYLESVRDPFSYFYILAKVHKHPWKTRPIVSVSGSLIYGIGKWLDQQLQPIIKRLPTYLSSSFTLKDKLDKLAGQDLSRMSLFTGDVIAMYPSIDLEDAFERIRIFLHTSSLCTGVAAAPIMEALRIVMTRNCIRFGDTYWQQVNGTAMGAPPAPSFATLYYGIFELDLLTQFGDRLLFLCRYIDDQFGIWIHHPDPITDRQQWEAFKQCQQNYCSLNWEFSELSQSTNFLDLTVRIADYRVVTSIYEKPLNLHLYIPPHSSHTPSARTGLVTGNVFRILRLTTERSAQLASLSSFYLHLLARGYKPRFLHFAFQQAFNRFTSFRKTKKISVHADDTIFLHLQYHPRDPPRKLLQRAFQEHLIRPQTFHRTFARACNHKRPATRSVWNGWDAYTQEPIHLVPPLRFEPHLWELRNADLRRLRMDRMVVVYSRPHNLKNLLFPRHVEAKCPSARPASAIQAELIPAPTT